MQNFKPYGNPFWLRLKPKWVLCMPLFVVSNNTKSWFETIPKLYYTILF